MSAATLWASRIKKLPPYLFVEIDTLKKQALQQGKDVIDLGVGDPDQPTPAFILQAMARALRDAKNHCYPTNKGLAPFREAIARWYRQRFGVTLDPATEILPLLGSKEGIAHLPLAFVNPGDSVLVPDPGYPPYRTGTVLAGGRPVAVPLLPQNGFLPDLEALQRRRVRAKLLFLNYPNNPTSAVTDLAFFKELVRFSRKRGIPICHDAAYSELYFGKKRPVSFLQAPGAKTVGIEFHSLSKTFNMTGWRIGWACGNRQMIAALAKVKSNIDSGIFQAVQMAGIKALAQNQSFSGRMRKLYRQRRDLFVRALNKAGCPISAPEATFYLWAPIPKGTSSQAVARKLVKRVGIVATPGIGFGRSGEGFIRFSLSVPSSKLRQAAGRLAQLQLWPGHSSR